MRQAVAAPDYLGGLGHPGAEQRARRAEVAAVWQRFEQVSREHEGPGTDLRTVHYVWSLLGDP